MQINIQPLQMAGMSWNNLYNRNSNLEHIIRVGAYIIRRCFINFKAFQYHFAILPKSLSFVRQILLQIAYIIWRVKNQTSYQNAAYFLLNYLKSKSPLRRGGLVLFTARRRACAAPLCAVAAWFFPNIPARRR